MAKKEDIFGKLKIKDYNNILEGVLEAKKFSSDTKNFLLSMLYKIETAYNDYCTVKNSYKPMGQFIEEIIETIQNNCEKIELIKPLDKEYTELMNRKEKCIVNKEKKEIICVYNEQNLLYAISKLSDHKYKFKKNIVKQTLQELINNGKDISNKEVIRDFDGWAWHIETKLIESIECNLVFQNIIMLIGEEIQTEEQIKQNLRKIYQKEKAENIYILICKIALLMYLNNHNNEKSIYQEQRIKNQKDLTKMENKIKYLENIIKKRRQLETRIREIDQCLIDSSFLKKEYIKTNKKLEEDKKIFSISDFEDIIQNEKEQLVYDLQKYNKKMLPKNYIKEKEELKEALKILEVLEEKRDINDYIIELQIQFLEGMQEKIKQVQTRNDVMEIIYKLRYYNFLPYKDVQIKNVKELQEKIYQTEKMIYNVACKMNVLNQISINNNVNIKVLKNILNTNIIKLENIEVLFVAENYQITLKIFDEENIEKTIQYDTIEGLTARMDRKFRLFIR